MNSHSVPMAHGQIEPPKGIGVILCSCGGMISRKVDLDTMRSIAAEGPHVRDIMTFDRCCSGPSLDEIRLSLKAGDIDRLLTVGCSARYSSDRFIGLAAEARIGPDLVRFCDLLDMCTTLDRKVAGTKAEDMLRTALSRTAMLQVVSRQIEVPVRRVLVIGNGTSAKVAAGHILDQGFEAIIANPGGSLMDGDQAIISLDGDSMGPNVLFTSSRLELFNGSIITSVTGHVGRFEVLIDSPGKIVSRTVGAMVVAMDKEPVEPSPGVFPGSMTQDQFGTTLKAMRPVPSNIVMVAMDVDGEAERSPMSTHEAVHNAMHVKGISPQTQVTMIAREIYAFGQCEVGYRKAQDMGVRFIRSDAMPTWQPGYIMVRDLHSGFMLKIPADLVVVDDRMGPKGIGDICHVLGIPLARDGTAARGNPKVRPSGTHRQGIFVCGSASEMNLGAGPTMSAIAAAAKATSLLRSPIVLGGNVAEVFPEKCSACLTCVRTCPYHSPSMNKEGKAEVDAALCRGCGMCAAACPSKAIQVYSYRDDQIVAEVASVLKGAVQ